MAPFAGTRDGMDVVVSICQPAPFPWLGHLQKLMTSDVHVVLDDATFQKDGFLNRVRLKAPSGARFITIPVRSRSSSQRINQVAVSDSAMASPLLRKFEAWYGGSPHFDATSELLAEYLAQARNDGLVRSAIATMSAVSDLLGVPQRELVTSSSLNVRRTRTSRLVDLVHAVGGNVYVYGPGRPGRAQYLDLHELERAGIRPAMIRYADMPYEQLHGSFESRLSVLDSLANVGVARIHDLIGHGEGTQCASSTS